jgi:serine/threonine-protein kinase RsbW
MEMMQRNRTVELHIPSLLGWERTAMEVAASVAKLMGFPAERVEDIKTAVSEATLNAIEHGGADADASRRILIVFTPEGDTLGIDVRDGSPTPFGASERLGTPPSLEDQLAGRVPTRGWGTFLIKSLVDEVEFASTAEGNVVRMLIHLEP